MRRALLMLSLLAGVTINTAAHSAQPCPGAGHGKLLIHGGGKSSRDYTRSGMELCGGPEIRVVLVPYAAVSVEHPEADQKGPPGSREFEEDYSRLWTQAGARNVTVLNLLDVEASREAVRQADYIFFGGGDQVDLL